MIQLLVILAVIAGLVFFTWLFKQPRNVRVRWLLYLAATALIVLVLTNRLHWLGAVFAGLLVIGKKLFIWARFLPLLGSFFMRYREYKQRHSSREDAEGTKRTRHSRAQSDAGDARNATMSREEAFAVLELQPGATREEIIAAHKRLIQKMHPDRGGSTHLAQKINRAKDKLLEGL